MLSDPAKAKPLLKASIIQCYIYKQLGSLRQLRDFLSWHGEQPFWQECCMHWDDTIPLLKGLVLLKILVLA